MTTRLEGNVAVLDLTHGGAVIAKKLAARGNANVTGVDVYRTLPEAKIIELENSGVGYSKNPIRDDFDVIVAPVHLDTGYEMLANARVRGTPVLTHHEAVGELLDMYDLSGKTIVEVTGTKAKTSTCILLSRMLAAWGKKVMSHTSRGVEILPGGRTLMRGLSITPASILSVLDACIDAHVEPDVFIFEVSLGGTGKADVGVITTITEDYGIANNTSKASEAKRRMVTNAKPGSTLVLNRDYLRFLGACRRDVRCISFCETADASCTTFLEVSGKEKSGKPGKSEGATVFSGGGRIRFTPSGYDLDSYRTAIACSSAAALAMGVPPEVIEMALSGFSGVGGRMKKTMLGGNVMVDNSSSGMDIQSAARALEYAESLGGGLVMVLGEEAKEVCEGLNPSDVEKFILRNINKLKHLVLVGDRMSHIQGSNIHHSEDLPAGLEQAAGLAQRGDIVLSCVKCFR